MALGLLPFLGKPELVLKNVLLVQANPWPLEGGWRAKFVLLVIRYT